jgi:uncharacterized protein YegJ (DUF2314 family)
MAKLLLHVASVVLLIALGRRFGWDWWVTTGAVVLGAVCVHLLSERLSGSSRHIGAAAVSNDDPLMRSAFDEARQTWPQFLQLFADYPKDALVKFRLATKSGDIENVWGDLLELGAESATVYLRTLPVGEADLPQRRMSVPVTDIVDWQVMLADGSLRGGFTQQATFRIIERQNGTLPPRYADQLSRYRPGLE